MAGGAILAAPMMPNGSGGFTGDSDIFDPRASIPVTAEWLMNVRGGVRQ